ncbi:hypothetical protein [Saccharopolyspora shandongensis]|uniref:hypothetical protein n=1 Tax=Saccharopolyspora shandongensis TaxID=418495 RepID=UPI0033FFBE2F
MVNLVTAEPLLHARPTQQLVPPHTRRERMCHRPRALLPHWTLPKMFYVDNPGESAGDAGSGPV